MSNRGGKREGAGRKPLPEGQKKVAMTITIDPKLREYLRQTSNQTAEIEAALRESVGYRMWLETDK